MGSLGLGNGSLRMDDVYLEGATPDGPAVVGHLSVIVDTEGITFLGPEPGERRTVGWERTSPLEFGAPAALPERGAGHVPGVRGRRSPAAAPRAVEERPGRPSERSQPGRAASAVVADRHRPRRPETAGRPDVGRRPRPVAEPPRPVPNRLRPIEPSLPPATVLADRLRPELAGRRASRAARAGAGRAACADAGRAPARRQRRPSLGTPARRRPPVARGRGRPAAFVARDGSSSPEARWRRTDGRPRRRARADDGPGVVPVRAAGPAPACARRPRHPGPTELRTWCGSSSSRCSPGSSPSPPGCGTSRPRGRRAHPGGARCPTPPSPPASGSSRPTFPGGARAAPGMGNVFAAGATTNGAGALQHRRAGLDGAWRAACTCRSRRSTAPSAWAAPCRSARAEVTSPSYADPAGNGGAVSSVVDVVQSPQVEEADAEVFQDPALFATCYQPFVQAMLPYAPGRARRASPPPRCSPSSSRCPTDPAPVTVAAFQIARIANDKGQTKTVVTTATAVFDGRVQATLGNGERPRVLPRRPGPPGRATSRSGPSAWASC